MPEGRRHSRAILLGCVVVFVAFVAGLSAGIFTTSSASRGNRTTGTAEVATPQIGASGSSADVAGSSGSLGGSDSGVATSPDAATGVSTAGGKDVVASGGTQMLIENAGIDLRVDDVQVAIAAIRKSVKANGGFIADMSVSSGTDTGVVPLDAPAERTVAGPASASITVRVPASSLEALEHDVSKVGRVLSQSASSNDVTQEYVDLAARLRNLKAEESRLRSFLTRANKVSDLLSVERELGRVRGEIEAMQAQLDYLKRQVARATLTITLSEPGPIIQPTGNDWGFSDAVTQGVRGAAAVLTALITIAIAAAPLAAIIIVAVLVVRGILRRRSRMRMHRGNTDSTGTEENE